MITFVIPLALVAVAIVLLLVFGPRAERATVLVERPRSYSHPADALFRGPLAWPWERNKEGA